jgi:protein tyrosine/serine phosphatase
MPLNNFGLVGHNVYRSAQPEAEDLATLRALGITVVLKLNTREESNGVAGELGPGIDLIEWPLHFTAPDDADTKQMMERLRILVVEGEVILMHCEKGRDRTGFVSAAYEVLVLGHTLDEALGHRADYGVDDPWHRLFNESFTHALKRLAP